MIKGIYKITSPVNKIYIGQSIDIDGRWYRYNRLECKAQKKLYNSLNKYGPQNHKFEIVCELPLNITQEDFNTHEVFHWQKYKDLGFEMLNTKFPGSNGPLSKESIEKMRETKRRNKKPNPNKGKTIIEIMGEEGARLAIEKQIATKKKNGTYWPSKESNLKRSKTQTGKPQPKLKGRKHSPEACKKIGEAGRGRKIPPEAIEKRNKTCIERYGSKVKPKSEETLKRMSEAQKNRPPITQETRDKLSKAQKGRVKSKAHLDKFKKPVLQYSLDNVLVEGYESAQYAKQITGITSIVHCLKGYCQTAGGFIWKYKNMDI